MTLVSAGREKMRRIRWDGHSIYNVARRATLFARLRLYKVRLHHDKFGIREARVDFLECIISTDGVRSNVDNVDRNHACLCLRT